MLWKLDSLFIFIGIWIKAQNDTYNLQENSYSVRIKFLFQFFTGQCDGTIPKITEHPEDTFVARNDPATLRCQAEGDPDPKITWWKDGTAVETATSNPKVIL